MNIKKMIYLGMGFIFLGSAFLGVFLPLIPTTPFLLLAAFFFARSSERWHAYLFNHKIFGQYLRDYQNHEMTTGNKWRTLAFMWIGMVVCMVLLRSRLWLVLLLAVIGIGVTIHLVTLKNARRTLSSSDSVQ